MSDSEQRNTDRYWRREETALGRAFNDVMDGARELANRVQYVLPGRTQSEREMFQRAIREDREEKQWTRAHYKQTGRMETRNEIAADAHYSAQHARTPYKARQEREIQNALGGGEHEAAQVRERLDYAIRQPGPGEIAERRADLAGDATVDKGQINKMIGREVVHVRKEEIERFDINAPWRENLPQVNMDWMAESDRKQMGVDPGYRNEIGRASEERYSQDLARRSSTEIANGWTQKEAEAMNVHLDTKATKEWERSEPSAESVRKAERMADATDPMHDARREQQADNYKRQDITVNHETQHTKSARQILPFVDGKENGTMDSQLKTAKQHVREREQERWNRVEQIGRQAIDSDKARVTEKPTVTTEADLATKAERQRPQTA